jgi:ubiquinone/menaquinone biosynthesis C-methylase UbiE/pimeloyl-ACP methyl ester carboxylesterase
VRTEAAETRQSLAQGDDLTRLGEPLEEWRLSTFVLIHGAGDVGWSWHRVEAELRARGHDVVAPDLPGDDDSLTLDDYAEAVVTAVGDRRDLIVVAHSFGGFTAPLVAVRLPVDALVFVAGMVPAPGEAPDDWWANTGYRKAVAAAAARDGGATGNQDPYVCYYHDVPRELAAEALSKERAHPSAACGASPWPLETLPDVPTHFILCTEDRFFPPDFVRRTVAARLGVVPDEIAGGHCVALSRPKELADILEGYAKKVRRRWRWIDHYDAELRSYNERLRAAMAVNPRDRILDIGCGSGQTTREAARAATLGSALGVDISEEMLARARNQSSHEGISNVAFERGDAQNHRFTPEHFDLVISRFGTMFFADPVAAFSNIAHAARPGARLVMLVWQAEERNEWATLIRQALTGSAAVAPASGPNAFSLADPDRIRAVLEVSGFSDIDVVDLNEPVYYGPDLAAALDLVLDMKRHRDLLAQMDAASAQRALARLRELLAARETSTGVLLDSRAWLVTARRARG